MNRFKWFILSILSFALLGILYINSNPAEVLRHSAEGYLKDNNTKNAIKTYEQAFEAGLKDFKSRNNYVNLIIKTDTDAEEQEKLKKFAEYDIDDTAKYRAEHRLAEISDEFQAKYSDTYIKNAPYNHKIIRWSTSPITYGFVNAEGVPEYYFTEIEKAFNTWTLETAHKISLKKVEDNPDIIVKFNAAKPSNAQEETDKFVVAYTNPVIESNTLRNMIIDFFLKNSDDAYFTKTQIYNTALHEIGHALGVMGHSRYSKDLMNMTMNPELTANDREGTLSTRDVDTILLLYEIKPDITNTQNAQGKYIPQIVIGENKDITSAKIQEAKNYIKKAPNLPAGYIDLAEALVAVKEYQKAIKSLNKALKLSDSEQINGMIYYNLAIINHLSGNDDDAKVYLEKSMQINDSENHHLLLADIYLSEGSKTKAINEYESLIKKNPSNIEYIILLTNIYVRDHKYKTARKILKQYLDKNPNERSNPRLAPYGIIRMGL